MRAGGNREAGEIGGFEIGVAIGRVAGIERGPSGVQPFEVRLKGLARRLATAAHAAHDRAMQAAGMRNARAWSAATPIPRPRPVGRDRRKTSGRVQATRLQPRALQRAFRRTREQRSLPTSSP